MIMNGIIFNRFQCVHMPMCLLTPSLYEIGNNTELLVQKYDELYSNKIGNNDEWISSVKEFFVNYNTNRSNLL